MSLMQLLSVGQSFLSIEDGRSPYRMTQQNLLPKFGPTRGNAPPESAGCETAKPSATPTRTGEGPVGSAQPKGTEKRMTAIEAYSQIGSAASFGGGVTVPQPYPAGRWNMIRNPFQRRSASQKSATMIQGELSLAGVRPVRNDLNEADLEVVPRRSAPAKVPGEPVRATAPAAGPEPPKATGFLWSRLRLRLLKRA